MAPRPRRSAFNRLGAPDSGTSPATDGAVSAAAFAPVPATPGGVQAVDTALEILETIAYAADPIGVTQIAAAAAVTKSAAFRHLQTLLGRGYILQDPVTSRFRLGPKTFLIGRFANAALDLGALFEPAMRDARDASGHTVVLSTPTPHGAFVVSTLQGLQPIEIGVRPGSQLPLCSSAQGRISLAFGPPEMAGQALAGPIPRFTVATITDPESLAAEIVRVRARRWAVAPEEMLPGVNALAAPVCDAAGRLVAAVAMVGSIQHIAAAPEPRLVSIVHTLASHAERALHQATGPARGRR